MRPLRKRSICQSREGSSQSSESILTSPIRVALYPTVQGDNPFLRILTTEMEFQGATIIEWDDTRGGQSFDIAWLNWFENSWDRLGRKPSTRRAKRQDRTRKLARLEELRSAGTKVVWMAHNLQPHTFQGSRARWEKRTSELFGMFDGTIHLTEASRNADEFARLLDRPSLVVRHPNYELVNAEQHSDRAGDVERLLMLGAVTKRKNYMESIDLALSIPGIEMIIAGKVLDSKLGVRIRRRAEASENRLRVLDRYLSDDEIHSLFDGRTAALINQPGALNSGVMYLALSRGAPIICRASPTNNELSRLFGREWVRVSSLDRDSLLADIARPVPQTLPNLDRCNPRVVSREILEFFEALRSRDSRADAS